MGQKTTLLLLAILCFSYVMSYPSETHFDVNLDGSFGSSNSVQFCGTQLATAISIVCNGNYNTIATAMHLQQKRDGDRHNSDTLRFPFQKREDAHSFLRFRRRRRRGVSDECCKKACSYAELRSFCGPL